MEKCRSGNLCHLEYHRDQYLGQLCSLPLLMIYQITSSQKFASSQMIPSYIDGYNHWQTVKRYNETSIGVWEEKWCMKFHPDKCNVLRITRKRTPFIYNYCLHDHALEAVSCAKYLGVTLSQDLSWTHILTTSGNKTLGFVMRNLNINNVKVKEQAYMSLVRPTLEYACTV